MNKITIIIFCLFLMTSVAFATEVPINTSSKLQPIIVASTNEQDTISIIRSAKNSILIMTQELSDKMIIKELHKKSKNCKIMIISNNQNMLGKEVNFKTTKNYTIQQNYIIIDNMTFAFNSASFSEQSKKSLKTTLFVFYNNNLVNHFTKEFMKFWNN